MNSYTSEDIYEFAKRLTGECQAAGLDAEQHGAQILVRGPHHHLNEQVTCRPDQQGRLRWYWSWGMPITRLDDPARLLTVDDAGELIRSIRNVVTMPLR